MEPRKDKYRLLMEHLPDAFAYHQIVTDKSGNPVDYIFLDVNPAFSEMTGLSREQVIGKKVTKALPGIEDSDFDWIGTYGRVALGGEIVRFEQYSKPLDRWYAVTAYSDEPGYFVVLFRDITAMEQEKETLAAMVQCTQNNLQQSVGELNYQQLTDDLLQLSDAKFVAINTYEEEGTKTVTRAISGITENIRRASEILGFELTGKAWDVIPERAQSIRDGRFVRFENLYEASSGAVSKQVSFLLEKMFGLGEVCVVEISHQGKFLGDFIIFLSREQTIKNPGLVKLYASQAGIMFLRSRAEKELQKSREKTATALRLVTGILESSENMVIFALDREYRYLAFNENHRKTMKQIWGADIETGNSMLDYISDTVDREKAKVDFDRALGKEAFTIIEEYGNTELERRWYEYTYNPLYDAEGKVIGLTLILSDITESKQAEEALQQSEERYRLLIENANEAIIVAQDGFNVFWNPKAIEFFAQTEEELKSIPFLDFIHPEDKQKVMESHNKRMSGEKKTEHYSFRIIDCNNNIKWAELKGTVITWNNRNASLNLITDITNRKEAEQKLHDHTIELELKGIELEELYQQLDQELDKARSIHERTLPKKTPEIAGLSMHAYYQPAQRMGGDFYNIIKVGNNLILYVSDVSGHGLEGTLLSAFVKATIDSYTTLEPENIGPGLILRHLNRQYRREDYPADYFICIFLMVLDLGTMELSYTGLGSQELPLVQGGCGERWRLESEGPPISSAIPEEIMNYVEGKIQLTPGTTVLISTDGITEQQAGEEQYNGRLEKVFYEHSHLPPEIIVGAVREDFYLFNGGSMQGDDDITLGIIQVELEETRKINLELESNIDALSFFGQAVANFIPETATVGMFSLGLHELAANAMEHGNNYDPQKKVTVAITVTKTYIFASITDEGPGFDWIQKKDKPLVLDVESERGRGIAMTQVCGGRLYYNEKGNRAFLVVAY